MNYLFSIIIPTYKNNENTLLRAINSVKNQNFNNWELIIIDDNESNNEYFNITKLIEKKNNDLNIKFIFHNVNKGANAARNTGIRLSKGKYVAFLDGDDEWDENYLNIIEQNIKKNHGKFYSTNYRIVSEEGIQGLRFNKFNRKSGYIYNEEIYEDIISPTSAVVVEKKLLLKVGGFDERLPARQDYDLWLRLCENNEIYFIYDGLVYVYRDGHYSISQNYQKHIAATVTVMNKILRKTDPSEYNHNRIISSHYRYISTVYLRNYDFKNTKTYALKSLNFSFNMQSIGLFFLSYVPFVVKPLRNVRKKFKIFANENL